METLHTADGVADTRGATPLDRQHVVRAGRRGEVVRVLPGIWLPRGGAADAAARARAVLTSDPHAVITGRAAARLSWWPELAAPTLTAARTRHATPGPGFRFERRRIDPDHVVTWGGVRITSIALTVLDLGVEIGPEAIDEALRRGVVTLEALWATLKSTPGRRGNVRRRDLLIDSRDEPWSEAERALHHLLRRIRLPCGFLTNHRVGYGAATGYGSATAYLDCALPDLLLGLEVDGHEHHAAAPAFTHDRVRDAGLAAEGWQIVRLASDQVFFNADDTVAVLEAIIRARLALVGERPRARPR